MLDFVVPKDHATQQENPHLQSTKSRAWTRHDKVSDCIKAIHQAYEEQPNGPLMLFNMEGKTNW